MYLALGLVGLVLWLALLFFLGVPTLFKGRYVLFVLGVFLPILWAFGALLPARN